jgi:hypothetical protein
MQYRDIRPAIKSGDILAWSHRSGINSWHDFKLWAIRLFTQSEYNHVGTAWVVGERVFVIEAVIPLVRIYPLSKLGDFYHLAMSAPWKPSTEALALSYIGHEYSQFQAMQAPFTEPAHDTLWECAELVARVARNDHIELGTVYTPSAVVHNALLHGAKLTFVENLP